MTIIPEVIILETIKNLLKLIRTDYNAQSDKSKSFLHKTLGTLNLERYVFLTQAEKVFITNIDDPRALDVVLFFNATRAAIPTIHIVLQSEQHGGDGLGIDVGHVTPTIDPITKDVIEVYTRRFNSQLQLVTTSDNSVEVMLIYAFLKAALIPLINHLELSGLEKIQLSGNEVNINSQLVPNVFVRQIGISYQYEMSVENFYSTLFLNNLIFHQDPLILGVVEVDQSDSDSIP